MKQRNFFAVLWLAYSLSLSAQTQQGYVKTLGRPNQQGRALSGVSIRVKGGHNAVLSGQDGKFEMPMPGKKVGDAFSLQQVQKSGYDLKDKGVVGRQYAYSDKVPLTLVMLSRSDYQQDKQQIENHIYAAVEKRYKSDLSRLEQQLSSHQIATEQYRQQLQQLQDGFGKIQDLVDGLADHYALVDYDELDEREREITLAIERGDLEQADQLLQQMNIQQRAQDIAQRLQSGQALKEEAQRDMAEVLKRQEKDAEYLYQLYTIALGRFEYDKARFYLETRAELDTLQADWQFNVAYYLAKQNQDDDAIKYYNRALGLYADLMTENQEYMLGLFQTMNNLAVLYKKNQVYDASESMYLAVLEMRRQSAEEYPQIFLPQVVETMNNLGALYNTTEQYEKGEEMYKQALAICKQLAEDNPQEYVPQEAMIQANLAILYHDSKRLSESEAMYAEALKTYRKLEREDPQTYEPILARVLNCQGVFYKDINRYDESEKLLKEALQIRRKLTKMNPQAYKPDVAETLFNMGSLYLNVKKYNDCELFYKEALELYRILYEENQMAYDSGLAITSYHLGRLYEEQKRYQEACDAFEEALPIYRYLAEDQPTQKVYYENILSVLTSIYSHMLRYPAVYRVLSELLPVLKRKYEMDAAGWKDRYVVTLGSQPFYAIIARQYAAAEQHAREALSIDPTQQWIYTNLAPALLCQGKTAEAEKIYRQCKEEFKDGMLDDFKKFEEAGAIPEERKKDVERIKQMLNE
jgi:tetratricopeptide (TPR) repeat protein